MIDGVSILIVGIAIGVLIASGKMVRQAKQETGIWRQSALDLSRKLNDKGERLYS